MSCKHENWSWCEECKAEDEAYIEAFDAGKKDGWEACEVCHGIVDGKHKRAEALTRQVAEQKAEIERLLQHNARLEDSASAIMDSLSRKLTSATAHNKLLRDALCHIQQVACSGSPELAIASESLAIESPDDALKEYDAALVERCAKIADAQNEGWAAAEEIRKGAF